MKFFDIANVDLCIIIDLGLSAGILEEKSTTITMYACDGLFVNV